MTRKELLEELRYVLDDTVGPPYAWRDERLLMWLADGEDRFCEQTGYFMDASAYTITTEEGVQSYPLPSDRIIEVKEVFDGAHKLRQYTELDRPQYHDALTVPNKRPQAWQTDRETGKLTLFEPPLPAITLTLRVHRRALKRLTEVATSTIPEQCHRGLVHYAAAQAFEDHDRERQDPVKAGYHWDRFRYYIAYGANLFDRLNGASPQIVPSRQYVV